MSVDWTETGDEDSSPRVPTWPDGFFNDVPLQNIAASFKYFILVCSFSLNNKEGGNGGNVIITQTLHGAWQLRFNVVFPIFNHEHVSCPSKSNGICKCVYELGNHPS